MLDTYRPVRLIVKQGLLDVDVPLAISHGQALRPVEGINPDLNLAIPFSTNWRRQNSSYSIQVKRTDL
jgi:hypothetical protein